MSPPGRQAARPPAPAAIGRPAAGTRPAPAPPARALGPHRAARPKSPADADPPGDRRQPRHRHRPGPGRRPRAASACRPAPSPPRPSRPSWTASTPPWTPPALEAEAAEADARDGSGPQYADILAAHARMIADPDAAPRRPATRSSASGSPPSTPSAKSWTATPPGWRSSPTATSPPAPPTSATSSGASWTSCPAAAPVGRRGRARARPAWPWRTTSPPARPPAWTRRTILGFATEAGGRTSHTAIVAAALEIPAVVGLGKFLDRARHCRTVDHRRRRGPGRPRPRRRHARAAIAAPPRAGRPVRRPRRARRPAGRDPRRHAGRRSWATSSSPARSPPASNAGPTASASIAPSSSTSSADRPPTEDEQFASYAAVVRSMDGRPVTIRTLDLGADKLAVLSGQRRWPRGTRSSACDRSGSRSATPALFRTQLRAILRASTLGDVRIMFPLVSTLGEFRRARAILDESPPS